MNYDMRNNNPMFKIAEEQKKERLNEISVNCQNEKMQIINYNNSTNIDIKFLDTGNIIKHQCYSNFKKGSLKDYYLPTYYGVGIVGEYSRSINYMEDDSFRHWDWMLKRCYNKQDIEKYPSYSVCEVCDEWKYYKNLKKWFEQNYYECGNEKMTLDKDILHKGNKIYSPEHCIFVPERINILFTKNDAKRGEYPIGVSFHKRTGKFNAQISKVKNFQKNTKKQQHLGLRDTPEEAFNLYKEAKENYIKEVADIYQNEYNNFPNILYEALCKYTVDIKD